MQGAGCRVQGAGCRVEGAGRRVYGVWFTLGAVEQRHLPAAEDE